MVNKIKQIPAYKLILDILFVLIILAGIVVSIRMNIIGRSLWYDEAALAYSFVRRSFTELTATGLELVQSAPVGWLYAIKILCAVFGYSDFVMRVPSIIMYVGTLALLGFISKKVVKMYYFLAPVAFAASVPLILQYSNVFKPYISDAFMALLVILLFYLYKEKKLNLYIMAVLWGSILWFSSTACFVEGGIIIASFIVSLLTKDKEEIKKVFFSLLKIGIIILVFFAIYYVYWLRKVDDGMHGFWADWSFKLLPLSWQDIVDDKRMVVTLIAPFYYYKAPGLILGVIGLVIAIYRKNVYILSIYGILLVTAFASMIGMYPVNKRLWLFVYPLLIIVMFYVLDFIVDKNNLMDTKSIRNILVGVTLFLMVLCNGGIRYYMNAENVYWPGYEVKAETEYLEDIIEEGDGVYVSSSAMPMFLFYNNYNTEILEKTGNDIVVGEVAFSPDYEGNMPDHTSEIEYILSKGRCYLVMSDTWDDGVAYKNLYDILNAKGNISIVYDEYDTPLLLFEKTK